jgi:exopolysaccharide biosynthesis polyprenyl glycosylphosphotransferase
MKKIAENPDISVVIPVYNSARTLKLCLESICHGQTFPEDRYEVIVIDDGSTDRSPEIAKAYPVRYHYQKNQGPGVARNEGVAQSRGDIVLFTDSDCVPEPDWIEEMVRPVRENSVIAVKGAYVKPEPGVASRFAQMEFEERYDKLEKAAFIDLVDTYAAAFVKRDFQEAGGFDPNFPVANNEDVDLSYKLSSAGKKMAFNRRAKVRHLNQLTLPRYLRTKFLRAYWRMMVYKRFPGKMISDTYTPQTLKFQIVLVFLFLFFLLLAPFYAFSRILAAASLLGFLLMTAGFCVRSLRRDPLIGILSPVLLFLRSLVFGFGIVAGGLSQKRKDLLFPSLLVVSDQVMIFLCFLAAYFLRSHILAHFPTPFAQNFEIHYLGKYPAVAAVFPVVFFLQGLYRRSNSLSRMNEFVGIFRGVSLTVVILMSLAFLIKFDASRLMMIYFWVLTLFALDLSRYLIRLIQGNFRKRGYNAIRAVIVGSDETGRMVLNKVMMYPELGYKILGFVDDRKDDDGAQPEDVPVIGALDEIHDVIGRYKIDEVFLAKPDMDHRRILDLLVKCEAHDVSFRIVSDLFDIVTGEDELDTIASTPVVDVTARRVSWLQLLLKRVIDLLLGAFLLALFSPFMLLAAALIRVSSGAPAVLKEDRVGRGGILFKMYRFKTTAGVPPVEPPEGDRAYTPVGRFLVKANLDELPQLLNVLKGDMSLVGPRPEYVSIVRRYEAWQRKRFSVKPGITGLWQIVGRKDLFMHRNLEYDFYYIKNQSLLLDLLILIKTVRSVLFARGLA